MGVGIIFHWSGSRGLLEGFPDVARGLGLFSDASSAERVKRNETQRGRDCRFVNEGQH